MCLLWSEIDCLWRVFEFLAAQKELIFVLISFPCMTDLNFFFCELTKWDKIGFHDIYYALNISQLCRRGSKGLHHCEESGASCQCRSLLSVSNLGRIWLVLYSLKLGFVSYPGCLWRELYRASAVSDFFLLYIIWDLYLLNLFSYFPTKPFFMCTKKLCTLHLVLVHSTEYTLFLLSMFFSPLWTRISESNPSHWLSAIIVRVLLNWRYCAVLSVDPCFIELSVSNPWLQAAIEPICLLHPTLLWPPSKTF